MFACGIISADAHFKQELTLNFHMDVALSDSEFTAACMFTQSCADATAFTANKSFIFIFTVV